MGGEIKHPGAKLALTGEPDSLLGLLVSQTMVCQITRKIEVIDLALVDLWLGGFYPVQRVDFVIDESNNLLAKSGFHYQKIIQRKSAASECCEDKQLKGNIRVSPMSETT